MARYPVIPQHLLVDVAINGTTATHRTQRTLTQAKIVNSISAGSTKNQLTFALSPSATWPWGLRAMDDITVDAWASSRPTSPQRARILTGKLDVVAIDESPEQGRTCRIDASNLWKCFEVTTESAADYSQRINWFRLPVKDILYKAAGECGIGSNNVLIDPGLDILASPRGVAAQDPSATINPMYQNWAAIIASAATMAGRELFADEAGFIRYQLSHYNDAPFGSIPMERLISVSQTLDTDVGIINRVAVRYDVGPESSGRERDATLPTTYDFAHYHDRIMIIPAPWITNGDDAQWYADWVVSWAAHNTRPAVVSLAFWPQARIGSVLTFAYPSGQAPERYYVTSVVHDIKIPGPAVTVLGLTYGRPLDTVWTAIAAPPIGGSVIPGKRNNATPNTGAGWTITYYTLHDPGQPALTTGQDKTTGATFVQASSSARYYTDGWIAPGSVTKVNYGERRPCAFDPTYTIPELGCSLSIGDILRLADGTVLDCQDTGGGVHGRHLDVFFWADLVAGDHVNVPASPQSLTYMNVAESNLANYPVTNHPAPGPTPPPDPNSIAGRVVAAVKSQLGQPYVWGGNEPGGFDCSGLMQWAYSLVGISLLHNAQAQYDQMRHIQSNLVLPGDLIFLANTDPSDPTGPVQHVGMYVGNDQIIAADNSAVPIEYDRLSSTYWQQYYYGAGRPNGA